MFSITGLTADPIQNFNFSLPDGSRAYLTLTYRPRVKMWFLSVTWNTFTVNNLRVYSIPNLLEQYSNNVPFGLLVRVSDGLEPMFLTDFQTGRVTLWGLNQTDVQFIDDVYAGLSS